MNNYKWIAITVNLVIVLGLFNYSILKKEDLLDEGQLILLELAPVDPRSLIQGDYMRLSYAVSTRVPDSIPKQGYCVVELDENGVGQRLRFQALSTPLNKGEYLIKYQDQGGWQGIKVGAESFFFQEGEAQKYEEAEYGGLKVDREGNSLLVGLYNKEREKID
ncbi:MAG: GDYXXLXY domain-containing protein [Bacteroidota bacterium]